MAVVVVVVVFAAAVAVAFDAAAVAVVVAVVGGGRFSQCSSLHQASSRRGSTREWCMETRGVYLGRWMIARKYKEFRSLG